MSHFKYLSLSFSLSLILFRFKYLFICISNAEETNKQKIGAIKTPFEANEFHCFMPSISNRWQLSQTIFMSLFHNSSYFCSYYHSTVFTLNWLPWSENFNYFFGITYSGFWTIYFGKQFKEINFGVKIFFSFTTLNWQNNRTKQADFINAVCNATMKCNAIRHAVLNA